MMNELDELYQEMILDHASHPHHFGELPLATHSAKGLNPVCSDEIYIFIIIQNNIIVDIAFKGEGCVLSRASASMMTDLVKGKSTAEFEKLFSNFRLLFSESDPSVNPSPEKLKAFSNVKKFPMRIKCVTLAWHALRAALKEGNE